MGLELAKAYVLVGADTSRLPGDLNKGKRMVGGAFADMKRMAASVAAGIVGAMGIQQAFSALRQAIAGVIKEASRFEQVQVAFETMIGSVELASYKLQELSAMAAKTPFTLPGIEKAAKMLLATGFSVNELIPQLKSLGDIAAGLGGPSDILFRVAHNLGQVRAQGRLTGRELRDFAVMGIPLIDELIKILGVSKKEIYSMTRANKISSEVVEQAFKNMSGEGGKFYNLMARLNQTLRGQWSNLKDELFLLGRAIGNELIPTATEWVKAGIQMIHSAKEWIKQNKETVQKTIKWAINLGKLTAAFLAAQVAIKIVTIAINTYKAALQATVVAQTIATALTGPAGWAKLAAAIGAASVALTVMNSMYDPGTTSAAEEAADSIDEVIQKTETLKAKVVELEDAIEGIDWKSFGTDFKKEYEDIIAQLNKTAKQQERLNKEQEKYNLLTEKNKILRKEEEERTKAEIERNKKIEKRLNELSESLNAYKNILGKGASDSKIGPIDYSAVISGRTFVKDIPLEKIEEDIERKKEIEERLAELSDVEAAPVNYAAIESLLGIDANKEISESNDRLKERRKELEKLFREFSSFGDLQSVFDKATKDPIKALDRLKRKLDALVRSGKLAREIAQNMLETAKESSPLGGAVRDIKSLQQANAELSTRLKYAEKEAEIQIALNKYKEDNPYASKEEITMHEAGLRFQQEQNDILKEREDIKSKNEKLEQDALSIQNKYLTKTERIRKELSEIWRLRQKGLVTEETYQRALKDYQQQAQFQNTTLLDAGRFGFSEFSQSIQNALLRRDDPNKITAEESKKQTTLLQSIDTEMKKNKPTLATLGP